MPFTIIDLCIVGGCLYVCVPSWGAEAADGNAFHPKHEGLLNPCLPKLGRSEGGEERLLRTYVGGRFRYMDGLRRFPSFITRGRRTSLDAELILQKKQGGRATTSLVSPGYKSTASAAALKASSVSRAALHDSSLNSLKSDQPLMQPLWVSYVALLRYQACTGSFTLCSNEQ